MNRIILLPLFAMINFTLMAQGGADIHYIDEDRIDAGLVNQKVRPDFKPAGRKNSPWIGDTVVLKIDGEEVTVIEKRRRGVDYWYYKDQYLKSEDQPGRTAFKIFDVSLTGISGDSLRFSVPLEYDDGNNGIRVKTLDIWVNRRILAGIMIQE